MHIANVIEGHTMINFAKRDTKQPLQIYNHVSIQMKYEVHFKFLAFWTICNGYNTESCQKAYNNDNNAHSINFYW